VDWIRPFSKSGQDLTGLRGRLIQVSQEELQKLHTRPSSFVMLSGLVYNVTPYMDYHPGGEDELMKAAGMDGTELFDQVHRWVNYESMLKECLVGKMAPSTKGSHLLRTRAVIPPPSTRALAPPASAAPPADRDRDGRPRYDWFQTDVSVHLVVYAKRKVTCLSSSCTSVDLQAGVLREALLGKMSYMVHLRLAGEVEESVAVQTAFSVGKIQVSLRKKGRTKWTDLGQALDFHNTFVLKKERAPHYCDGVLVSKTEVNHNTLIFRVKLPPGTIRHVPVGRHVYLKALVEDAELVRPYTPVDQSLTASPQETDLFLMVKVYPDGVFSSYLSALHIVENPGDRVLVSGPEGAFSLRPLRDVTHLYLLAAGTGLTPMTRLISLATQEMENISRKTTLLFFNRGEEDILWRGELDQLAADNPRFQVEYILSEPSDGWRGRRGRVDGALLQDVLLRPDGSRCFVCVCGPTAFTELTLRLAKQHGFRPEELHAFQG
uniref:Cytochrome b5 reductase 4 n=1 Tax=Tetraodon nigroviridis TaxID=99883 RepID=H3CBJ7_TETNG